MRGGFQLETLETLGMPGKWLRSIVPGAALLGKVPASSALDTLLRLFTLGEGVQGDAALSALGGSASGLVELGLLVPAEGRIFSRFQLIPIRGGWVASDFIYPRPEIGEKGVGGDDYVMGIGPSSVLLHTLVPPIKSGTVLELGCGIAWLSSLVRKDGVRVTSTDLNPKALRLAAFQAKLRNLEPLDLREGDGFSTVSGEKFDVILSNPPYVQSPGGERIYREGKAEESICGRLLGELPEYLAPGGMAVVLINWMHTDAESAFDEGPLEWIPEKGLRRWLFQSDCSSPADYAWLWIGQDPLFAGESAVTEMKRWLDFYKARGTGAISSGFVVIQKCDEGEEWTRTDSRAVKDLAPAAGGEVYQIFKNETWLARGVTDDALLSGSYSVPDGLHTTAEMVLTDDGWHRQTIRLTSPGNLAYDGQIDENLMRLLELCRAGESPSAMVAELRAAPEFAAIPDLESTAAGLVRELVRFGLLVPVGRV